MNKSNWFFNSNLSRILAAAVLLLALSSSVFAQGDPPVMKVLDGNLGHLKEDTSITVEDVKFFDPGYAGLLDTPYRIVNIVSLEINEGLNKTIGDFRVAVDLNITYTLMNGTITSIPVTLELGYNDSEPYTNKQTFVLYNAVNVEVEVIEDGMFLIEGDPDSWKAVKLINQLQSFPRYHFSCTESVVDAINDSAWAANTDKDELPVYWEPVVGADEYDLEWTYIDSSALASGHYGDSTEPDPDLIFEDNASRVTITGTLYNIPLIYDNKGHLFFRVRPVQWQNGGGRKEANWSSVNTPDGLGRFDFNGHERNFNWQATTTFAEEGKRKTVVQYYDGSLRSRQTVTKDNTTNQTIVAESFYDYQGRPVIQVLPSPTLNTVIGFTQNFNRGLNGNPYDKSLFDTLAIPDICNAPGAPAMDSTVSGAAHYYSASNPLSDSGFHKFIPKADGFPFTEVEYTSDNTGRISRQSGVGAEFRLGSGHETKYAYGSPLQRELDALFGTEVGDWSHYFKTMVRDANGQYSVSYTDMRGRTIATALASALHPASEIKMDKLPSYSLTTSTESLADHASVVIKDLVMENKKSLLVSEAGNYTFNYRLDTLFLKEQGCTSNQICYECLYDLQITISDDCNNQKIGTNGKPFDTTFRNFSIGSIDTSCGNGSGGFTVQFTKYLPEGSYEVTKKLSVNKAALDYYRDSIFMAANMCKTIDSFLLEQRQLIASVQQCEPACQSCRDSIPETFGEYWESYKTITGITQEDSATYWSMAMSSYAKAKEDCDALCDTLQSDAIDIRKAMLMDMTPSSGQYANVDSTADLLSVFFFGADGSGADTLAKYTQITNYKDADGNPDFVFDEGSGKLVPPQQLTPDLFVQKFKNSWAESLLQFHPEKCKLDRYEELTASHIWDRRFGKTDTYAEAMAHGYLNPTGNGSPPFFNFLATDVADIDPLSNYSADFKKQLQDSITGFRKLTVGDSVTMWGLATVSVMCTGGTSNAICFDSYRDNDSAFNTSYMCTAELDMAWRVFRQLYLDIKRNIINSWINSECDTCLTATQLMAVNHSPHFSDASELLAATGVNVPQSAGEANDFKDQQQDSVYSYYEKNCRAYAELWLKQLGACVLYDPDSIQQVIIPLLVEVCKEGADENHAYGSSTVKPGSAYTYKNFEEVLRAYNAAHDIEDSVNCNAFLITAPKPYHQQVMYSNKPLYEAPDSCECATIAAYYNNYLPVSADFSSFSDYMQQVYQTTISDSIVTLLLGYCHIDDLPEPECSLVSSPIYLPPVFQCYSGNVCVNCLQFKLVDSSFRSQYPGVLPAIADTAITDSAQLRKNLLYEQYMNYKLGFVQTAEDYLLFLKQCQFQPYIFDTAVVTCEQLNNFANEFLYALYHPVGDSIDLEMRTFAGNITPAEGPKGVFDVNGNLIANTIDGTVAQIDSSFAAIWNSSTANQTVGEITPLPNGKFRLHLNPGQAVPCNGLIGQRYYQFEAMVTDSLEWFGTGIGSYIDFGDSTYVKTEQKLISNSKTLAIRAGGQAYFRQAKPIVGYDYLVHTTFAIYHYYDHTVDTTSYTVTVYHTDTLGTVVFKDMRPQGKQSSFLNLRGYFPQHLVEMIFEGTRDSTINRTREIRNFDQITSMQLAMFRQGDTKGGGAQPFIHNNLGNFQNNHGLRYVRLDVGFVNLFGYSPTLVTNVGGRFWSECFPNFSDNFPDVRFLYWGAWNSRESDLMNFTWELPRLKSAEFTFMGLPAGFIDSFYNQVQRVSIVDSGQTFMNTGWAGVTSAPPTAASAAAKSDLIARDWITLDVLTPLSLTWKFRPEDPDDLIAKDTSLPLVHPFTGYFNTAFGTSLNFRELMGLYKSRCGSVNSICSTFPDTLNQYLTLCGRAAPVFPAVMLDTVNNCTDSTFFIVSNGREIHKAYTDSLKQHFDSSYLARCMQAYKMEKFTVRRTVSEFHYTLYYYDQAGNLVKTVPPAGVQANYDSLWLDSVRIARLAGQVKVPSHNLITQYRYNTLNQVVSQKSPDGGKTDFWYDRLGRLVLSRNAKQRAESSSGDSLYSYTRYDELGRITEVGQLRDTISTTPIADSLTRNETALSNWFASLLRKREQVTKTVYDIPYTGFSAPDPKLVVQQQNLRNRVSFVTYADLPGISSSYNNATFYSYDIHGNVDTLLQDYGRSDFVPNMMNTNGNRWKKFIYQYDLISGKVNMVMYQRGFADQWFHRYTYDAENRLTIAETSADSITWEKDAQYEYYRHGPLARTVIGHQQVQGMDYAYTLQGWLKGMNSTAGTAAADIGSDGKVGALNQYTARDGIAFTLNYFAGDYKPLSALVNPFPNYSAFLDTFYRPLYNGNISSQTMYNKKFDQEGYPNGQVQLYSYRYDQLNRLTGQDGHIGFNMATNSWAGMTDMDDYMKERITYDGNGNIQQYFRNAMNGHSPEMDNLTYSYYAGTNRLRRVRDSVLSDTYVSSQDDLLRDIDDQPQDNYGYDAIGNLIKDSAEKISNIKWSVYGKILEITRQSTGDWPVSTVKYSYDAQGNRISKLHDFGGQKSYTWYVRDAQGNLMSTYVTSGDDADLGDLDVVQEEREIYGSSRLGMYYPFMEPLDVDHGNSGPQSSVVAFGDMLEYRRGFKRYELTNHLGNVLANITDIKFGVPSDTNSSLTAYYEPQIVAAYDYYPFGMLSRIYADYDYSPYKFGFNGKEFDHEAKGYGAQLDYVARALDTRVGRWASTDAKVKPWASPYASFSNNPVNMIDPDGKDEIHFYHVTRATIFREGYKGCSTYIKKTTAAYIQIVKTNGPDKFYHHNVYSNNESVHQSDEVTELFPWNRSQRSGITKSTLLGFITVNDRDRGSLMKYATANPELKKYFEERSKGYSATTYDKENYKELLSDLPSFNTIRAVQGYAELTAAVVSIIEGGLGLLRNPAKASSGFGDLTVSEVEAIQGVVNQAGRPLEVGGSAASGTRRGVGTDLPIGKGPGTKSDIDYIIPNSSIPYFKGLETKLPSLDPKSGVILGNGNPYIGPLIRFEPGASKPIFLPAVKGG